MVEDNEKYRLYPFFPYEEGRRFEVYSVEIEQEGQFTAEGHSEGTEEFITVYQGEVTVSINDEKYTVRKGDSIRFKSDKPHSYLNSGDELAIINMVMHYQL